MRDVRLLGQLDPNFAWDERRLLGAEDLGPGANLPQNLRGAAASAEEGNSGEWRFLRDPLGINKLFWAGNADGTILVAARPHLLVEAGCSFEDIRAMPAGSVADLGPGEAFERSLVPNSWYEPREGRPGVEELGGRIRAKLDGYLSALVAANPRAQAYVCLSGGLDSTGIAAVVREYFPEAVAVSFDLKRRGGGVSEDRLVAQRLAGDFGLSLLEVDATEGEIFGLLDTVLLNGIDWRDFNVHTGLVNAMLAREISDGVTDRPPIVFTGDLANEFLADYEAEEYRGTTYYRLPRLSPASLRDSLVRGLDTCHREIGVFAAWGLPVVQPYAVAVDDYLMLGDEFLRSEGRKQLLCRSIFGDLIPDYVFSRIKTRAQVGDKDTGGGVLAACVDAGFDGNWLRLRFAELHDVEDPAVLNRFVRAGRYATALPTI